jgi:hypothetical protein
VTADDWHDRAHRCYQRAADMEQHGNPVLDILAGQYRSRGDLMMDIALAIVGGEDPDREAGSGSGACAASPPTPTVCLVGAVTDSVGPAPRQSDGALLAPGVSPDGNGLPPVTPGSLPLGRCQPIPSR